MPRNVLSPQENEWLDVAFGDPRLRETSKPDEAGVEALRLAAAAHARVIFEHCPTSADRSAAIRLVRETYLTAVESLTKKLPRV